MAINRLRIGLSPRLLHTPPRELKFPGKSLQYLEQSLPHWIMQHGALAFMIPTTGQGNEFPDQGPALEDYVMALDGLVLQGGADVSPRSYGELALRPEWAGDLVRDTFEIALLREFVRRGKPVLGICRGAQLINVALGGTLYQDVVSQGATALPHLDGELYDTFVHEVDILAGSRLEALLPGVRTATVNSIHHQAIRKLGKDLTVEARARDDGLIEAIRWSGDSYLFGCQWHPEFQVGQADRLDSDILLRDFLNHASAQGGSAAARHRDRPGLTSRDPTATSVDGT